MESATRFLCTSSWSARCTCAKYLEVRQSITDIFESNHRCYGYRRLQASLTRQDVAISEKVVQRLMKQESLVVPKPRKRRYASYLGEISPAPENLINRDFQATVPNEKWDGPGEIRNHRDVFIGIRRTQIQGAFA